MIIISILVGLVLLIIIYNKISLNFKKDIELQTTKYEKELQLRNIINESQLTHLGGHPYLKVKEKILFQIKTNNTVYFYKENTNTGAEIPISNLTRYEVKTETEIQKDVTLTRLLTLGIFAFGVKKKTKTEDQYLILSYMQNEVEINCIFKRNYSYQQLGNIVSQLNRLKIEENIE